MNEIKIASLIINHFNSKLSFKTSEMWIEWRETVLSIYEDKIQSGEIDSNVNSGKIHSKKIKSKEELSEFLLKFSTLNLNELFNLLILYKNIVQQNNSYIPDSFNEIYWQEIIEMLFPSNERNNSLSSDWLNKKNENSFKTIVNVNSSLKPIFLDILLRITSVLFYNHSFFLKGEGKEALFGLSQFVFIPIIVFFYAIFRDKVITKKTQEIIKKIGKENISLKTKITSWNYFLIILVSIIGSFIPIKLNGFEFPFVLYPFLIFFSVIFYLILIKNFSKSFPRYQKIVEQLELKEQRELNQDLNSEKNDEEIINLEVNLKSENDKMDAYVIEAALFGALAFSGFVQLISVGEMSSNFISEFHFHVQELVTYYLNASYQNVDASFNFLFSKEGLIVFLAYQTLLCSVFFLSVIASRLRYSKLSDDITRALELTKSFNEKEEFLIQEKSNKHLLYNKKIKELLKKGYKKQDEIEPIMSFMEFFRSLGIGMFFIILIFSGLFISKWFSLILLILSVLSIVYFKLTYFKKWMKLFYISMQEFYYKNKSLVNWMSWSTVFIGVLLRTLHFEIANIFIFLGFTFLFLHHLIKLVIPQQFDFDLNKNKDVFNSYANFQKILSILFNISFGIFLLGFMFKAQHWPGAGIIIICSLFLMIVYFILVKKTYEQNFWLQALIGFSISVCLLGVMFRFMNWQGSSLLAIIGIPAIILTAIITYFYKSLIRKFIQKAVYTLFFIGVLFFFDYLSHSVWTMNFNYSDFKNAVLVNRIENKLYDKLDVIVSEQKYYNSKTPSENKKLAAELKKIDILLEKINYNFHVLNDYVNVIIQKCDQKILLNKAEFWMISLIKADDFWLHRETFAQLLLKNNKKKEALNQAIIAYKEFPKKELRIFIQNLKKEMNQ